MEGAVRRLARSSKARLTEVDRPRFPEETLFDRLARAVCRAGCLPRKELYEAWEMARRVRRRFRGGRVVDVAGGHGLLAQTLLLLDGTSAEACVVDPRPPSSAAALHAALVEVWPRLAGRVTWIAAPLDAFEIGAADLVVSCHACGALTDRVLASAADVGARVAVLPCCHDAATCDAGALRGWMDHALAADVRRAQRLEAHGYRVRTHTIPADITPQNRLLLGDPGASPAAHAGEAPAVRPRREPGR